LPPLRFALCGCSDDAATSVASTPERAVKRFLAPWQDHRRQSDPDRPRQVRAFWRSTCDTVDPKIRPGLRLDDGRIDERTSCGATVVLLTAYTGEDQGGENQHVASADEIWGRPLAARRQGNASVVTVEIHYASRTVGVPAPPARATINVLAVRRGRSWYVATMGAFNPLAAIRGGLSESELRREHERLLAAAEP
jgi:hypothetical protein